MTTNNDISGDPPRDGELTAADGEQAGGLPQWDSSDLLRGRREALIVHGGEVYRLRCTRNGKLILQK